MHGGAADNLHNSTVPSSVSEVNALGPSCPGRCRAQVLVWGAKECLGHSVEVS